MHSYVGADARKHAAQVMARQREDEITFARQALQNFDCAITERDAMHATTFHAGCRNGPHASGKINFRPFRPQHFARPRSAKDAELKRTGTNALRLAQLREE